MREPAKQLDELGELQEENEDIANIPTELEISGRKIKIKSRTMPELVIIDRAIYEYQKYFFNLRNEDINEDSDQEEIRQQGLKAAEDVMQYAAAAVFKIINEDYDNPEYTQEWIMENIPVDKLNEIVIIYKKKNMFGEFLKNLALARMF